MIEFRDSASRVLAKGLCFVMHLEEIFKSGVRRECGNRKDRMIRRKWYKIDSWELPEEIF